MPAVLYTARLHGDLALLPRLYTFIRQLREAQPGPSYLLDLGDSCAPAVWHCAATGGRSTLLVLDAMGYDAALVAGLLTGEARERLAANMLALTPVDAAHPWDADDLRLTVPGDPPGTVLTIMPGDQTRQDGASLTLAPVEAGQVGIVRFAQAAPLTLVEYTVHTLPVGTPPAPTIAAAVDFVTAEARRYADKRDQDRL